MNDVRALTLWRPWDATFVHGPKRLENRGWLPPQKLIGTTILLHAGQRYDADAVSMIRDRWPGFAEVEHLDTAGQIVAAATLVGAIRRSLYGRVEARMAADGWGERIKEIAARCSKGEEPWFFGPCAWVLDSVIALSPIKAKGAQGLWRPDPKIVDECLMQIKEQKASAK